MLAVLMAVALVACGNETATSESHSTGNNQSSSVVSDENTATAVLGKFGLKPADVLTSVCDHTEDEYMTNGTYVIVYSVYVCVKDFSYDTFYQFMCEIADASRDASVDGALFIDNYDFETMQKTRTVFEGYAFDGLTPNSLNQNVNFYYNTATVKVHVQLQCFGSDANRFHVRVENSNN